MFQWTYKLYVSPHESDPITHLPSRHLLKEVSDKLKYEKYVNKDNPKKKGYEVDPKNEDYPKNEDNPENEHVLKKLSHSTVDMSLFLFNFTFYLDFNYEHLLFVMESLWRLPSDALVWYYSIWWAIDQISGEKISQVSMMI